MIETLTLIAIFPVSLALIFGLVEIVERVERTRFLKAFERGKQCGWSEPVNDNLRQH